MLLSTSSIWSFALSTSYLTQLVAGQGSFNVQYCSGLNTADTPKNSSIYQSNGLCHDFCNDKYAFAVVQADGCWCSNYAPATTNTGCTETCPGYPVELCGGVGVYGYVQLQIKPSGIRGAIRVPSSSPSTSTMEQQSSTTEDSSATTTSTSARRSSSTWVPTPVISLETVTGQVRTVTVTPTQPPDSQKSSLLPTTSGKGGLSTGGAVGLTVGLVALVAIVGLVAWFCLKKRRKEQKQAEYVDTSRDSTSAVGGPIPSRSMSENSRYVLGTDGRQVVETWVPDETAGKRKSRLMPVDQRLDPFSPVYQHNANKSHESVNTIRDDHDYSRRVAHNKPILRATNPD